MKTSKDIAILKAYGTLADKLSYKLHSQKHKGRIFFYHKLHALKMEIARQLSQPKQHKSLHNIENLMRQLL